MRSYSYPNILFTLREKKKESLLQSPAWCTICVRSHRVQYIFSVCFSSEQTCSLSAHAFICVRVSVWVLTTCENCTYKQAWWCMHWVACVHAFINSNLTPWLSILHSDLHWALSPSSLGFSGSQIKVQLILCVTVHKVTKKNHLLEMLVSFSLFWLWWLWWLSWSCLERNKQRIIQLFRAWRDVIILDKYLFNIRWQEGKKKKKHQSSWE